MKRILITGINSYLGGRFRQYMEQFPEYATVSISMRDGSWRGEDFTGFDVVYHVAGLAHSDNGRISPEKAQKYYEINTDLTKELAKKAKREGVKQFIFMSSAIVYGDSAPIGRRRRIDRSTVCTPANCYGDSKLQAELGLRRLEDKNFRVVILRPPMIYGPGCKGNYPVLSLFAQRLPVFPYVDNERSMLFVDNLMAFVKLMIDNEESGTFFPQNAEYSNTSELVRMIAEAHGKKLILVRGFTWALKFLGFFTALVDKAFGSLSYDMSMSEYPGGEYRLYSLEESIRITEVAQ
mgnify:FL=1